MTTIINGKDLALEMQVELKEEVQQLVSLYRKRPGLAVLLVGDNPASKVYVKNKGLAAERIGLYSVIETYSKAITEQELLDEIDRYNKDDHIHGILVQLPLPDHIDEKKILLAIDAKKDVDGFHPMNLGLLFSGSPSMLPCTPYGIIKMLDKYTIELEGKEAVIIGRSNIVGKPMAHLLLERNATVTIAHSRTKNLSDITSKADILIVAIGKGNFITKEFVKEGAVVIDVGMNRDSNGKLIGDVKFDEVSEVASHITPVPRGVGPMTITMLMQQTVDAFKQIMKEQPELV
ncbi:MAG: bifunctional methylenetetrahydrofolate dehydrogenase/methenyltetrahydrofolate cyclohydrolase [Enterococcus sp.]